MKQNINLGAYGWRHANWLNVFYPEDLPEEWQLTYYSNVFNTVLVPVDYWQTSTRIDCQDWLDSVHENFQFFVEVSAGMFEFISLAEFLDCLKSLRPQLSALILLEEKQRISQSVNNQLFSLLNSLEIDLFVSNPKLVSPVFSTVNNIWRVSGSQSSCFAYIENDLSDLRSAKNIIEDFVSAAEKSKQDRVNATVIVHHPELNASELCKFRSVLEIMGF